MTRPHNASLQLQAAKIMSEHGYDPVASLPMLEGKPEKRKPLE